MGKPKNTCLLTALCVLSAIAVGCPAPGSGGSGFPVERVSVNNSGIQGDAGSACYKFSMSGDGRYVAFVSDATNLVTGDTNGYWDVFVYDRQTDTIERVSVDSGGIQGDDISDYPSISADGRYVAFQSDATNLVPGDTNASGDIFVRDRTLNTTARVSVATGGAEGNSISGNCSISADGLFVAFRSSASNLVSGDGNAAEDVFVRDLTLNTTERVSVATGGAEGDFGSNSPSISANGQYVAFKSSARNLVSGDTNNSSDIFVRDRTSNTTERVSVTTGGVQATSSSGLFGLKMSSDGRFVVFDSAATNLVSGDTNGASDIFVRDRTLNTTERVSVSSSGIQGDGSSGSPSLSADGRYIAFDSIATNLVPGDTGGFSDVFVFDRTTGAITQVSVSAAGVPGNGGSYTPSLSADGYCVAFTSWSSNLVSGDTNATGDVFVVRFR